MAYILTPRSLGRTYHFERSETIDELLKSKDGKKMKGAEVAVLTMLGLNPLVFTLPGGAVLPWSQYAAQYKNLLKTICVKHEAHAVFAQEGYTATSGIPAFSVVTSGPGAVQALIGIYDGAMEFVSGVVFTGNVPLEYLLNEHIRAFQSARAVQAASALAKNAWLVDSEHKIQEVLYNAFLNSLGYPQEIKLVDVPKDKQLKETQFEYFKPVIFKTDAYNELDYQVLNNLADAIKAAERPFVVIGRGAKFARYDVWELIERIGLPFGYTLKGKGILPDDHPQNLGPIGQHGGIGTNRVMSEADLVICIGTNGDDRAFLNPEEFTHGKRAVINPYLVNAQARLRIDYPIKAEADIAVTELLKLLGNNGQHQRLRMWNEYTHKLVDNEPRYNNRNNGLSPVDAIDDIVSSMNIDIYVLDVGEHQMHGMRANALRLGIYKKGELYGHTPLEVRLNYDKETITSGTAGTMHTNIGYASGAKIARPNKNVVGIMGDGGFEMNPTQLWIPKAYGLDISFVVINNRSWGQVFEWLDNYHEQMTEHAITSKQIETEEGLVDIPDFEGFARAYRIPFRRVADSELLATVLPEFNNIKGPKLLELIVTQHGAYPMTPNQGTYWDAFVVPKLTYREAVNTGKLIHM